MTPTKTFAFHDFLRLVSEVRKKEMDMLSALPEASRAEWIRRKDLRKKRAWRRSGFKDCYRCHEMPASYNYDWKPVCVVCYDELHRLYGPYGHPF